MLKKITSIFTGITVIAWLSGLALLAPLPVYAVVNEGDLIRGPDGIKVYIVNANGYKRHIYNPDVFDMYGHFTWESIQEVDQAVIDSYTTSDLYRVDVESQVYSVGEDGIKHWLNMTAAEFVTEGYSWNQVFIVNATEGAYYTVGSEIAVEAPVVAEGLTLALSDITPAAANIPLSSSVPFTKIDFTASGADVSITSIKVTRGGLGDNANVDSVTLYDGAAKLGNSRDINATDGWAVFNLGTPWVITDGTTKTLTVKATVLVGGYHYLGIGAAADVIGGGVTVTGSFPINGNTMSGISTGVTLGIATIDATTATQTKRVGETDVLLAEFTVAANGTEDLMFNSIALRQFGTASASEVTNFSLLHDGVVVDSGVNLVNKYATFVPEEPIEIREDRTETFTVRGDIGAASSGDTVILYVRNVADVDITSEQLGYTATISWSDATDGTGFEESADTYTTNIAAGKLTVNMDRSSTGTPAADTLENVDNVELATLELLANSEDLEISAMTVALNGTGFDDDELINVELYDVDSGAVYDLTEAAPDFTAGDATVALDDSIYLTQGVKRTFKVRADIETAAEDTDFIAVTITTSSITAEGITSGSTLATTDITPASVTGNTITVNLAGLTHQVKSLTTVAAIAGASDVAIYKATLKAGQSSGVKVRTIVIQAGDADEDPFVLDATTLYFQDDMIANAELVIEGAVVKEASSEIVEASGTSPATLTFRNVDYIIPQGETHTMYVKVDLVSTVSGSTAFYIKIDQDDGIVAEDTTEDKNQLTITEDETRGPAVSVGTTGYLDIKMIVSEAGANRNTYVVGGETSEWMGILRFDAYNEAVVVEDLYLISENPSSPTAVLNSLSKVQLYKEDKTTLISESSDFTLIDSNTDVLVSFLDLAYTIVEAGSEDVYVRVVTNEIGTGPEQVATVDTPFALLLFDSSTYDLTCRGASSGLAINPAAANSPTFGDTTSEYDDDTATLEARVLAAAITAVEDVMDDATLVGGSPVIAEFKITVNNGSNTKSDGDPAAIDLQAITFTATANNVTVTDSGASSTVVDYYVYLESDPATTVNVLDYSGSGADTVDITSLGLITTSDTLVIKAAAIQGSTPPGDSLQIRLTDLAASALTYLDGVLGSAKTDLRLPYTFVDGGILSN